MAESMQEANRAMGQAEFPETALKSPQIFDDFTEWKRAFEGMMEPAECRAKVEAAQAAGAHVFVRWANRAQRGYIEKVTDEGFLLNDRDDEFPERVFCTWDATMAVVDAWDELPAAEAYAAVREFRDRQEREAEAKAQREQIESDLTRFGVAYVLDGQRIDPSRVTVYTPQAELSDPDERQLGGFVRSSETSRKAALDAYPRQGSQRWRILDAYYERAKTGPLDGGVAWRGWTRHELAVALGMRESSVAARVIELVRGEWLKPLLYEGEPVTRKTNSGSDAAVLVLTEKALRELRERAAAS